MTLSDRMVNIFSLSAPNQCVNVELMGLSTDGAFAEYAAVSERY